MLLVIILGLMANLVMVSGACDVGTQKGDNFDFSRATGTWYFAWHLPNDIENSIDCVIITYAPPEGKRSLINIQAYNISSQSTVSVYGNATDWNDIGYWEESYQPPLIWSGRYYIIAIDYDRYCITKLCSFQSNRPYVYVLYRSSHPDEETVKDMLKDLQKNNIDVRQLVEWRADHC